MLRALAWPLGIILAIIYNYVGHYGISLIILTVIVRLALYPLNARQIKSTARMTTIQPKIKELQSKYAGDQETMNQKLQELYKEEKYSPTAGCLPMFIQMLVLMGLFELLRHPATYLGGKSSLMFAVHESFLWIPDLSQPDRWILPILAGITTYISYTISSQQTSTGANDQSAAMMNSMKYVFPLMILLMARSYPAGLSIYWFFGTLVQIALTFRYGVLRRKIIAEAMDKEDAKKARRKREKQQERN